MKKLYTFFFTIVLIIFFAPANAGWFDQPSYYLGAGDGGSMLSPDLSGTGYSIDKKNANSWKLVAGMDVTERLSVQGYYTNLGAVTFNPTGQIAYRDAGASAIYYAYKQHRSREGLSAFVKAGIGQMMNTASSVSYERIYDNHVMMGAGIEYDIGKRFALRMEADMYDLDARLVSVSLVKRFGQKSNRPLRRMQLALALPEPKDVPQDSDQDGVFDSRDQCPDTLLSVEVDDIGCRIPIEIALPGVSFDSDSDKLTSVSVEVLNGVVETLLQYPQLKIQIAGHTDSRGSDRYNLSLSERRANTVRDFLAENGVDLENLVSKAFGEATPVADNVTQQGRAQNRRVQFSITNMVESGVMQASVSPTI